MLIDTRTDGKVRLKLLEQSPHDDSDAEVETPTPEKVEQWAPSRFNVHATTDDGRLILWNSLSTSISVFKAEQVPLVLDLLKAQGFASRREGFPGYLADRGYLVRKGTDELRKFRHIFGQQHYRSDVLELILLASEDCNFRCTYCYEDFARGTMRPAVRRGIKRLVEDRIKHLGALHISWFGGEPLYGWAAIEELGPFFSEIAEKYEVPYDTHMTTNGYLLTPDVADKLLAWRMNTFQITLDGHPDDHDCSRPTRDGQGSFATIHQNLQAMARRKDEFKIQLRVNYDNKNHHRMEPFLELLSKDFRDDSRFHLAFHSVGKWGGANDENLDICGGEDKVQIERALKAAAYREGLRVRTLKDINAVGSMVCYAARPYNLIIGATGKVMKCTVWLDKDDRNVVGQIYEDGRLTLHDDRMSVWTSPGFEEDKQCQKCAVLPNCQGISCPLPRIEAGERSCISTRTESKEELFELLKYPTRAPRTREVTLDHGELRRDKNS
ncbi:MAG: radical SAM protein [Minicystis sp.]